MERANPVLRSEWELLYCLRLFFKALCFVDSPTFSGDAGPRAQNRTHEVCTEAR